MSRLRFKRHDFLSFAVYSCAIFLLEYSMRIPNLSDEQLEQLRTISMSIGLFVGERSRGDRARAIPLHFESNLIHHLGS